MPMQAFIAAILLDAADLSTHVTGFGISEREARDAVAGTLMSSYDMDPQEAYRVARLATVVPVPAVGDAPWKGAAS